MCKVKIGEVFRQNFSFPNWEDLDPRENFALIEKFERARISIRNNRTGESEGIWREQEWKKSEVRLVQRIKDKVVRFSRARLDLNHDGKIDLVYRMFDQECQAFDPDRPVQNVPRLLVMDETTGMFDSSYNRQFAWSYEVLLFQGRAHLSRFDYGDNGIDAALHIFDTVSGPRIEHIAIINIAVCEYEYVDQRGK